MEPPIPPNEQPTWMRQEETPSSPTFDPLGAPGTVTVEKAPVSTVPKGTWTPHYKKSGKSPVRSGQRSMKKSYSHSGFGTLVMLGLFFWLVTGFGISWWWIFPLMFFSKSLSRGWFPLIVGIVLLTSGMSTTAFAIGAIILGAMLLQGNARRRFA